MNHKCQFWSKKWSCFNDKLKFKEKGISIFQYIGCQHHVFDLVLRHSMNQILGGKTPSPNISYDFLQEVSNNH